MKTFSLYSQSAILARQFFKSEYKSIISANLVFVLSLSILFAIFSGIKLFILPYATDIVIIITYSILTLFIILTAIPLLYGLLTFHANTISDKGNGIYDIFCAFESINMYTRSLKLSLNIIIRFVATYIVPYIIYNQLIEYKYFGHSKIFMPTYTIFNIDLTYVLALLMLVLSIILSSMFFTRYFVAIYITVSHCDVSVNRCFYISNCIIYGYKITFSSMILMFIPLFIITILLFGVILFIYSIPIILLTSFYMSKEICNNNIEQYLKYQ